MAKRLKKYDSNMEAKVPTPAKPIASGVACTEKKCKGEMMIFSPVQKHRQLTKLRRASCSKCGWRGWV